jgi:ubiquinone/menaquinone biosynthesis C-methylase UbiE
MPCRCRLARAFSISVRAPGNLAIAIVQRANGASVVGVDFAGEMLRLASIKVSGASLQRRIRLVRGDATRIPLPDDCCDAATIAFGIRNVAQPDRALAELARVIRPEAALRSSNSASHGFPEFVRCIRGISATSCRSSAPRVETPSAYSYLPASVGAFPRRRSSRACSLPQVFHRSEPSRSHWASSICLLRSERARQNRAEPRTTPSNLVQ